MDSATLGMMSREELIAEVLLMQSQKADAESKRAKLEFELEQLKRMIFGAKSERFVAHANPNQLELDLGLAVEIAREEAKKEPKAKREKKPDAKKPVRQSIPDKFPRNVVVIEPGEDTTGMDYIGDEVTEENRCFPVRILIVERNPGTVGTEENRISGGGSRRMRTDNRKVGGILHDDIGCH